MPTLSPRSASSSETLLSGPQAANFATSLSPSTMALTLLPGATLASTTPPNLMVHASAHCRLKRILDVCGALVGLAITAVLFIPLAIAVRLDSPGPILFSQQRCGLQGRPFRIWKFRTMVADADRLKAAVANEAQGLIFKNQNDPRITRLGQVLRKTSLDEFPQFWNVLRGEMSLVGTRPPTLDEVSRYQPHHWRRLQVKPGITGEWQAKGRSTVSDFEAIVAMDLRYQARWSLGYDLCLLWQTLGAVLRRRGAC